MQNLTLIAAVDQNLALGYQGDLLVRIRADLKRFKQLTWGERVIYGKNTLLTFPQAKALKGRENVILAPEDFSLSSESERPVHICHSLIELENYLASVEGDKINFGIGGASVYTQLLPYANALELTEIAYAYPQADVYFPEFHNDFHLVQASEPMYDEEAQVSYRYVRYERN